MRGGDCSSTLAEANAGAGGNLRVEGNIVGESIFASAGTRSGTVTTSSNQFGVNAREFLCFGNVVLGTFEGVGGGRNTDQPTGVGGNGANVIINGSLVCENTFTVSGGYAAGANGGNAGNIIVEGPARIGTLNADGGASNNSVIPGGDAAANGKAPDYVSLRGGCVINTVSITDSTALTDPSRLEIQGHCSIGLLMMTDRANMKITPTGLSPVSLQLGGMMGKSTLAESPSGIESTPITGLIGSTTFINSTGIWYAVTGTSLQD